ncbi:MAG: MFS transporter [Chloroflexota bacterium]|nr:MFS transporter [Chloroflexota bacterium]
MPNEPKDSSDKPASTWTASSGRLAEPDLTEGGRATTGPSDSPPLSATQPRMGTFHALRFREFRLLWIGTLFASAGQWIQQATLSWVVYDVSGSGTLLGAMGLMRAIPMLLLTPFAGVAADRMDRKALMLISQVGMLLLALGLGIGLVLGRIGVWHLFVFTFLAGIAQAFNQPVRQTIVFDLVPRHAIVNAVAMSTAGFNLTRALGPSVAGFLIAWFGPAGNFFVQSAAYLGVVVSVFLIAFPSGRRVGRGVSVFSNLAEGFRYVARDPTARILVALGIIPPLLIIPTLMSLTPIFAKDIFHSGPTGLGFLLSSVGVGGVAGALFTASLGRFDRRGLLQLGALFGMSLAVLAFAFTRSLSTALPLLVVAGFCEMIYMSTNQAILQLSVPDRMRGRVTSILMLNMALMPVGGVVAGAGADLVGAPFMAASLSGAAIVLGLFITVFVPTVRRLRLSQIRPADGSQRPV